MFFSGAGNALTWLRRNIGIFDVDAVQGFPVDVAAAASVVAAVGLTSRRQLALPPAAGH